MMMNWVDWTIFGVIIVSAGLSLMRGFVKEAISLTSWLLGIWCATTFAAPVAEQLTVIKNPSFRYAASFGGLFLSVVVTGAIINAIVARLIKFAGASTLNKLFGVLFGLARGALVIIIVVYLIAPTQLADAIWWQESQFIPRFQRLADQLAVFLPNDVISYFSETA